MCIARVKQDVQAAVFREVRVYEVSINGPHDITRYYSSRALPRPVYVAQGGCALTMYSFKQEVTCALKAILFRRNRSLNGCR